MTQAGDAAEQLVRMSLEGAEVVLKISGMAAKEIAVFLAAALKAKNSTLKTKGAARLTSMLRSGQPLEIFSVKDSDLQKFYQGAKQYGIVYSVLRGKSHTPDGLCDIMVRADDAPKISRMVERFKFATLVDKVKIEKELVRNKEERSGAAQPQTEWAAPDKNDTEKLLDDLLGTSGGKPQPDKAAAPEAQAQQNPSSAKAANPRPSAPTSKSKSKPAEGTPSKPSVRKELREMTAARREQETGALQRKDHHPSKPKPGKTTHHKQPQNRGKSKSRKSKVRTR